MNRLLTLLIVAIVLIGGFYTLNSYIYNQKQDDSSLTNEPTYRTTTTREESEVDPSVAVTPVTHATMVLQWDNAVFYTDPTGGPEAFEGQPEADIILVTDIHGDHYSPETLNTVLGEATLIAPQAVIDMMPDNLKERAQALANDQTTTVLDFDITGVPMYNYPETEDARHTKGRGNGYLIERDGYRVYIAGDTGPTPEIRALTDIDMAFVPMNMPFTMSVEDAADAVVDFQPRIVYPYHYRGEDGLADVNRFQQLVEEGSDNIEVVLLNWYPEGAN